MWSKNRPTRPEHGCERDADKVGDQIEELWSAARHEALVPLIADGDEHRSRDCSGKPLPGRSRPASPTSKRTEEEGEKNAVSHLIGSGERECLRHLLGHEGGQKMDEDHRPKWERHSEQQSSF